MRAEMAGITGFHPHRLRHTARAALNEARKNRAPKQPTETGQLAPARGIDDDLEKKDNKP
jgi:integrase